MSGGGSSQPQIMMMPQQQQATTTNQLPQWVQDAGQQNYNLAKQIGQQQMGQYYTGPRVADMNQGQLTAINALNNNLGSTNPAFQQAQNIVSNIGDPTQQAQNLVGRSYASAQPGINGAMNATGNILNQLGNYGSFQPVQGYNANTVQAQTLPQGNMSAYMNPYTQNVINSSLNVLDQQRQNALNGNADSAINSRAFGGSRQAVQDAVTNSQFGLQGAQLAANLNNQNYQQAQQAMQQDIANNLNSQLANQGALNQAGQFNSNLGLQNQQQALNQANVLGGLGLNAANQLGSIGLQNANLGMNAGNTIGNLGLQGANLGLNKAQTLGNLATTGQDAFLNGANAALSGSGMMQQQAQNQLGANQQAFSDMQQSYINPLNMQISALSNTPYNTSTSSNSSGFTSQLYQPTSSSALMSGLGGALGGLGALGKFMSDEDEKTNIKKLGKDPITGIPMYAYDYKDDVEEAKEDGKPMPPKRVGPMAQDIEKVAPGKVRKVGGKKIVNLGFGRA